MDYPGKVITKNQVTPTQTSASGNWTLDDAAAATKNNTWPVALVPNPISRSLRFNSADSAYLNSTPASAGNQQKFTFSFWWKTTVNGVRQAVIEGGGSSSLDFEPIQKLSSDKIQIGQWTSSWDFQLVTTQVFRDPSAWYHVVIAFDTTQATSTNRIKLYINETQVTAFDTSNYPAQNTNCYINNTSYPLYIGGRNANDRTYADGYLTEVNFIDGQALTPSSFGMTNPQTGQWIPMKYTGTYGTNGFYLNFKDNSSTSALGYDYSGNSNNWTTNNFSVTAGAGNDSLTDVPTPWIAYNTTGDVGGVVRGNYCTLTPLIIVPAGTISNGNLDYNRGSTASHGSAAASFTLPTTGKWYWEVTACKNANNEMIGVANIQNNPQLPATGSEIGTGSRGDYGYRSDGNKYNNGSQGAYGATYTSGDVIGVAWDSDAGTLVFYKNGASQGTAFSSITQSVGKFAPAVSSAETSPDVFNFGQRPFAYTPPAGFLSLCSTNLPTPTIGFGLTNQGDDYFNTVLYTGTGSSLSVTGVGFQPDLVWIKSRSNAQDHKLTDAVRGTTKALISDTTGAETTDTNGLTAFGSDGFTVGTDATYNTNTYTYVGWNWKANGSGSSNTAGTITSTVSANTTSGFSIATFTQLSGSPYVGTVGHGLGVAPSMVIIKDRSIANGWLVYHASLGATQYLVLNSTAAAATGSNAFNDTAPTSTVFTTAAGSTYWGNAGATAVAYCFAAVAGYSAFGSYTGNGSTDGPFVFTNFRPRYLMIKRTDSAGGWYAYDSARSTYNLNSTILQPNLSDAEWTGTNNSYDFLSNGFKARGTGGDNNASGGTYIYAAFAESPFKFANAR